MPAPKGNTNNLKWTDMEINQFIDKVYTYVVDNKDCNTLVEAITESVQYEAILRHFKRNETIDFTPIKKAKDIIKHRIIDNGLKNKFNPTMSIFILKNNHDMKDKQEREHSGSINIPPIEFVE